MSACAVLGMIERKERQMPKIEEIEKAKAIREEMMRDGVYFDEDDMPKIEELKDRIIKDSERGLVNDYERDIILAAIEDAQRYKKDENGQWWKNYSSDGERWLQINENEIPAAVRAVLEVTGGGE